jgi:MFS family permease
MFVTLKSLASLLASYGLLLVANGLFSTLLGVRARIEGFAPEITGLIMSAYFVGLLGGALIGAHVVNRVGHIRCFAACASTMSVCALAHVMWVDPMAWALMRMAAGFCMAGMVMVTESWLNARAENSVRGQVLALYMITNYFCAGLGQFLLPLSDPGEFYLFCLVSILLSVALIPVLLTRAQAPAPTAPSKGSLKRVMQFAPLGVVGAVCVGLLNAGFNGMGPVYAQAVGLSLSETSTFMGSAIFGGLLLQWPIGWLSDRIDRRYLLAGVAAAVCVVCILMSLLGAGQSTTLFAGAIVYGAIAYTMYSLCAAHANDRAGPDQSMLVASAMLLAYGLGASLGPVLAGLSMSVMGPSGLFYQSAVVMGWLALFAVYRLVRRPDRPIKQPFVPMPATQYTSDELYAAARGETDAGREDPTVPRNPTS